MGSQVRPGRQGPADDSKSPQSMGRSGALLPPGGTGSVQSRTVRTSTPCLGDRAARHQAAVFASLQDAFPPEIHPADTTISRVAREMQKAHALRLQHLEVKTLQFQLTTSQKKRKLSEGLFLEDGEDDEVVTHDVDNYLDRLFTLLLAYAMAGCSGATGAPDAAQELNLGADTVKFVNVLMDVVYKYYFRAKRTVTGLPASQRMQWLQAKDVEERSEWVSKFRESTMSLGQVISEVYTSRDAHWSAPGPATPEKKTTAPTAASTATPSKVQPSASPLKLGETDQWQTGGDGHEGRHQTLPPVSTRRVQSQAMPPRSPPLRSGYQERPSVRSFQSWGGKLHWQALTHPRRGGGCLFWVKRHRAAGGATSDGGSYGGSQCPPYQSLCQLWLELPDGRLVAGREP